MIQKLFNKVALVTSASSGIGRATAIAFAREGAKVVLTSRNKESSLETLHMVEEWGGEGMFIKTDVTVAKDVENLVIQTLKMYGRLDCVFNNAGLSHAEESLTNLPKPGFQNMVDVRSGRVSLCMRYELPAMFVRDGGTIVNRSSTVGLRRTGTLEFAASQVQVYALGPAMFDTTIRVNPIRGAYPDVYHYLHGIHSIGESGHSEEIANTVVRLCSDEASFSSGTAFPVDRDPVVGLVPNSL